MSADDIRASFHLALDLYNRGDYLRCQELLDRVYAESDAAAKPLVRALLMLASGMHLHFRRGGGRGALNLLRNSLLALEDLRPESLGVEVGELYDALEAYIDDVTERRKPGAGFLDRWLAPRIRYAKV